MAQTKSTRASRSVRSQFMALPQPQDPPPVPRPLYKAPPLAKIDRALHMLQLMTIAHRRAVEAAKS